MRKKWAKCEGWLIKSFIYFKRDRPGKLERDKENGKVGGKTVMEFLIGLFFCTDSSNCDRCEKIFGCQQGADSG